MTRRLAGLVRALLVGALPLAGLSCAKVPLYSVGAVFIQADAAWFDEEDTLFLFWQVDAEQGLGDPSVIEIRYATDDERLDWTPIEALSPVHTHLPVDCGVTSLCGSTSLHVPIEPREVAIRLRYHRDGELALDAPTVFNVVGPGADHAHRSLVVYGVFDATNQYIQWRSRNQFPTVRNERATELGLRRQFTIRDQRYGVWDPAPEKNPYGYGRACPETSTAANLSQIVTSERAIFHPDPLPLAASSAAAVCAVSVVTDALGEFEAEALALKNPEVRSAFPVLESPVEDATPIPFFLAPCDRTISDDHEKMQRQRLFLEGVPVTCTEDWEDPAFVDRLVVAFRDAIETERPAGRDMVLTIAVNRDEYQVAEAVEDALVQVLPGERGRASPRVAGAFVFDSVARGLDLPDLSATTLWCPSTIPLDEIPDASAVSCATMPDIPDLELGPFSFGALPILPTRPDYLDFIDTYSKAQAGEVLELKLLAPEFPTTSEHFDLGEFGVVTFLNGEVFDADNDDAFSFCATEDAQRFVVRSDRMDSPALAQALAQACYYGQVPYELCEYAGLGLLPVEWLPDWHELVGDSSYRLGLFWEFPFLVRMEYETVLAGAVGAMGLTVPFGLASTEEAFYGTPTWTRSSFTLDPALTQCRRFCDHPTFDSAGVYHVTDPFRTTYAHACYLPDHPAPGDSGFPLDP